jgi:hypothetical protein
MPITGKRRSPVEGFEDYIIVEGGIIYHERFDVPPWGIVRCVTTRIDRAGYLTCRLWADGEMHTKFVHRLLAEAFVPNPHNLPFVDHKDGNKLNLETSNFRWCTHADNVKYAYVNGLISRKQKCVIDTATGISYASVKQAATFNGLTYSTLKNYLNGNRTNPTSLLYVVE